MRYLVIAIVILFALGVTNAAEPHFWGAEIEWGDTIPAGTVYNVKFDSKGRFKAERRGLPMTSGGKLTTVLHEATLSLSDRDALRELLERCMRSVNLKKPQGTMIGDGAYVRIYLWDGTVTLGAHLNKLKSYAEGGEEVTTLIGTMTRRLPKGFIK